MVVSQPFVEAVRAFDQSFYQLLLDAVILLFYNGRCEWVIEDVDGVFNELSGQ